MTAEGRIAQLTSFPRSTVPTMQPQGARGNFGFARPAPLPPSCFVIETLGARPSPGPTPPEATAACRKRKAIDGEDGAIGPAIGAAIKLYRLGLGGPQLIPAAAR